MAKLKAPLLSLGAAGAIGKTLVFFPWKGIDAVREYVIPANPDTQPQKDQRGYLRTMVAAVHSAMAKANYPLVSADQIAYSALAVAKGKIMTWFNQAVKLGLDCLVASTDYTVYSWGLIVNTDKEDFRPRIYITDDGVNHVLAGTFYLGTSKTNLIQSIPAIVDPGVRADLADGTGFSGLTAKAKYYWQFRPDLLDPCAGADSGIYYAVAE